jgi:transposase
VLARGSRLMDLHGIGPVVAARVLADTGDVTRTAERNRFASWTGTTTAPGISVGSSTASSGTPPFGPWGC